MSKVDASVLWGPEVIGRDKLDELRWLYAVEAPFDMPADMPDLIGMKVSLDSREFEIRGTVPRMPPTRIKQGELIELLVLQVRKGAKRVCAGKQMTFAAS